MTTKREPWTRRLGIVLVAGLTIILGACTQTEQAPELAVNLLTPNQATLAWSTDGFRPATGGGTSPELTRDTSRAWEGEASLHVSGDGSATRQGIWIGSTFGPDPRGTYTVSGYIAGEPGDQFFITFEEKGIGGTGVVIEHAGDPFEIEGTGWQRFSFTADMVAGESLGITVRHALAEPFEIWLDGLQLETGATATAWREPAVGKNLLTYNQATVEFDHRGFIPATGGGRPTWLTQDSSRAWEGESSLLIEGDGSSDGQGMYTWSSFVPDILGTYTFSVYLSGEAGDRFYLTFEEKGDMGTGLQRAVEGTPFTLQSDGWERHSIRATMEAGNRVNLTVRHAEAEPFFLWVDGVQLEAGPDATAWVAPPKP